MEEKRKYLRPQDLAEHFKVHPTTINRWDKEGRIKSVRTKGGHRRYLYSDIFPTELEPGSKSTKRKICYCRVSGPSQREDLGRQVSFFRERYPSYEIIKDIGSGLNSKRKGFITILDEAIGGNIEEIVVTYKDRLCRINFDLIERIVQKYSNGKIVVLNQKESSPKEELVSDLISIVTVFSGRLHGLRSHSLRRKIRDEACKDSEAEDLPKPRSKANVSIDV
jgi:predicted site-specific integrase-resolvase